VMNGYFRMMMDEVGEKCKERFLNPVSSVF
jgi:hypothetical protein